QGVPPRVGYERASLGCQDSVRIGIVFLMWDVGGEVEVEFANRRDRLPGSIARHRNEVTGLGERAGFHRGTVGRHRRIAGKRLKALREFAQNSEGSAAAYRDAVDANRLAATKHRREQTRNQRMVLARPRIDDR